MEADDEMVVLAPPARTAVRPWYPVFKMKMLSELLEESVLIHSRRANRYTDPSFKVFAGICSWGSGVFSKLSGRAGPDTCLQVKDRSSSGIGQVEKTASPLIITSLSRVVVSVGGLNRICGVGVPFLRT
jgi:hypothetical protein